MRKRIEPDKLKFDEPCMHQRENPSTVNPLLAQIQDLQNKVDSSNYGREFYDPETASSSGKSHVPNQPLRIPSPRGIIRRDSCLPHDTRNSMGTTGHHLKHSGKKGCIVMQKCELR